MNYDERLKFSSLDEQDATLIRLIHIPLTSFDRSRHERAALLSPSEIQQADRYRSETRRNTYVAGRAALRLLLSLHWSCPIETFCFRLDRHNKPYAQQGDGKYFTGFSLSHSPSQLAIGITPAEEIGIDVEDCRQRLQIELLVRNFFSSQQQEQWLNHCVEERERAFLRGWTRKEAAWKLFGNENFVAWNDIEITLDDTPNTCLLARTATGESLLLDCYTWQPCANSLASAVIRRHCTKKYKFDTQSIDFDKLSELVCTSGIADGLNAHAADCLERSSGQQ